MAKHMIPFAPTQDGEKELIDLAFSKKKADERKTWLRALKVRLPPMGELGQYAYLVPIARYLS